MKPKWSSDEAGDIEFAYPVSTGTFESLVLPSGGGCDVVILCEINSTGLAPFHLCLSHQVRPEMIRQRLAADPDVSQIVAIPARSDSYLGLVVEWTRSRKERRIAGYPGARTRKAEPAQAEE